MNKLLTIIYDSGIDDDIMEVLEQLHVSGYTKLFDAHGFGGRGKKSGDPVFPGTNNVLLLALPQDNVQALVKRLKDLQASFRMKPGITVMVQDVEVL